MGSVIFRQKGANAAKSIADGIETTNHFHTYIPTDVIGPNGEIDNYICWGTPNDLKIYQYWQTFFDKVNWHTYTYKDDYFTN